jgi:hypothetical protein
LLVPPASYLSRFVRRSFSHETYQLTDRNLQVGVAASRFLVFAYFEHLYEQNPALIYVLVYTTRVHFQSDETIAIHAQRQRTLLTIYSVGKVASSLRQVRVYTLPTPPRARLAHALGASCLSPVQTSTRTRKAGNAIGKPRLTRSMDLTLPRAPSRGLPP